MQIRWYKIGLYCDKCKKEPTLLSVAGSADGELRFDCVCVECGIQFYTTFTCATILAQTIYRDFEEKLAKWNPHQIPVKPPIKPAKNQDKKSDSDFLHDLGIEGGLE